MAKILVAIPMRRDLNPTLIERCTSALGLLEDANPDHHLSSRLDSRDVEPLPADSTPWSKVARARNRMLADLHSGDREIGAYDYILWIDADVVDYPADLPSRLIAVNPEGVTAPMVFVEGSAPPRFYDWAAFIAKGTDQVASANPKSIVGRNLQHDLPYWPKEPSTVNVEMDCVGTITMVPTWIYTEAGARYEDHPAFTDHYSICAQCRAWGKKVIVCRDVVAWHADLSKYEGEKWH